MKRRSLVWLLLFSGFAGLSYELLWVRQLALSLGTTTESFATVLAVFFGGLALGSRWAGRRSRESTRPVATYAALEALTGVLGLALLPLMSRLSLALVVFEPASPVGATVFRALLSGLLLLPPTFLMGATLPFLCSATIERDGDAGSGTALVYGVNTLGAVLGAYGLTYWLLPSLGVTGSTLVVVAINFAVAGLAWASSRRPGGEGPASPPAAETSGFSSAGDKTQLALRLSAFVMGFTATGAQVVWGRFFSIALKGTSYGIGAVLVAVLSGIALGSLLAMRLARRPERLPLASSLGQLVFLGGLSLFGLAMGLINYSQMALLNLENPSGVQVHLELLLVFAVLLVPTLAAGIGLPLVVALAGRSAREAGEVLSRLYSLNTFGCIVGSVLVGFVVLPSLGTNQTLFILIVVATLALAVFNLFVVTERRLLGTLVTLAALVGVGLYPGFDAREFRAGDLGTREDPVTWFRKIRQSVERIAFFDEGASATVMVQRQNDDALSLSLNGLGQGSVAPTAPRVLFESTLVAAMPVLHTPKAKSGLLIGLGSGGTAHQLLALGVEHLDVLELEKGVPAAVDLMWGDDSPLKRPQLSLAVNDARHWLVLRQARGAAKYDFIASMPSHPWVSASLFTTEFFELAAQNLEPGGVFSTWFGPVGMSERAIEGLLATFSKSFPSCVVYFVPEAGAYYLVGSKTPMPLDFAHFEAVTSGPAFSAEVAERRSPYFVLSRVIAANNGTSPTQAIKLSTDDNGLLEFNLGRARIPINGAARFFETAYLPLGRVQSADPGAVATELVEQQLGTPRGLLPPVTAASALPQAPDLAGYPMVQAYANARLAINRGKLDEARSLVEGLTDPVLKQRASLFLALAAPAAARRAQLEALPFEGTEVALARFAQGLDVATLAPGAPDDVARWLFTDEPKPSSFAARGQLARVLVRRLERFESLRLFERCSARATATGWPELLRTCKLGEAEAQRKTGQRLLVAGLKAGSAGQDRESAALLGQAHLAEPLNNEQLKLFLRSAVRSGDAALVDQAREALVSRGFPLEALDAIGAGQDTVKAPVGPDGQE